MVHPLAYIVKLNIEMSMAHLIKIIALGNEHNNGNSTLMLTLHPSPDPDVFTNDTFAEPPRQRRSLIRRLSSHEDVVTPGEPEDVAMRSHEQSSRKPVDDKTSRKNLNRVSFMEAGKGCSRSRRLSE
jgi:hypothetical protein